MEEDLYSLLGRLYHDLYRSKTVFNQLQTQLAQANSQIVSLTKELEQHKRTIPIPTNELAK